MNLDDELRTAFQEETKGWIAPPELKERVLHQISSKQGGRRMKKWILSSILAAALLVPTGAYAAHYYLADSIYGSQENVSHIGGTQQKYDELEAKLQEAKRNLTDEEFTTFAALLKEMGQYNLKIADSEGLLHPRQLSAEEQEKYTQLTTALDPLLTKLNEHKSPRTYPDNSIFIDIDKAKEILSAVEYIEFDNILKETGDISLKSVDANGKYHEDRLSETELARLDFLGQSLQAYLDKLDISRP
ncbi:DUF3600 domain-containing protein [Paenibacillus sp. FA6]|uniref:DUF3600 domain-containing protein n=1 Tax=Paenibacillus sp. FA6 TaxID=3413029 RepID=UPI003F660022